MPKKNKVVQKPLSDWLELQKIGETMTLAVSARGSGLCIYLPKSFAGLHGIISGDVIKIQFREHYRKRHEVMVEEQSREKS